MASSLSSFWRLAASAFVRIAAGKRETRSNRPLKQYCRKCEPVRGNAKKSTCLTVVPKLYWRSAEKLIPLILVWKHAAQPEFASFSCSTSKEKRAATTALLVIPTRRVLRLTDPYPTTR